jgi:hypothetical protein
MSRVLLKGMLLGESGVGKTSILAQHVSHKFTLAYKPNVGAEFLNKNVSELRFWMFFFLHPLLCCLGRQSSDPSQCLPGK